MRYRTTHDLVVSWGPNHTPLSCYTTRVPKGTECQLITEGCTAGNFWVKHPNLILNGAAHMELHDAIHYGIPIPKEDVEAWE